MNPTDFGASDFRFDLQRRWLVLFFDPLHRLKFWDRFNVPGFRHVALLAYWPIPMVWFYLDYAADGTIAATLDAGHGWRLIERIRRQGGTILEWETPTPKPKQPRLYPPNCVSFCQQFLGVRKTVWTPYGLAVCLAELNARPMFGSELPRRRQHAIWRAFRTSDRRNQSGARRPEAGSDSRGA